MKTFKDFIGESSEQSGETKLKRYLASSGLAHSGIQKDSSGQHVASGLHNLESSKKRWTEYLNRPGKTSEDYKTALASRKTWLKNEHDDTGKILAGLKHPKGISHHEVKRLNRDDSESPSEHTHYWEARLKE